MWILALMSAASVSFPNSKRKVLASGPMGPSVLIAMDTN